MTVMTRAPGLLALSIYLPDDFEVSHRRILASAIAEELLAIAAAVAGDVAQWRPECAGDRDDAAVFHSAATSARIRCWR
jgi:hypothetical protein